jgi:periplasmic protein TonB
VNTFASPQPPTITAGDRLGLTLFFSVVLHGIIILGVVFSHTDPAKTKTSPTLEIILAQTSSPQKPAEADYLAQANQDGGGNVKKRVRPTRPRAAPLASPSPGQNDVMSLPHAATPQSEHTMEVLTTDQAAEHTVDVSKEQAQPPSDMPSAAQLMMRSQEIAKLSADLSDSLQAYSHRPRQRYISASSQSYRDAAYLEAWRGKIERIGNLNYPEEARRQNLSGSLILDVAINADGSVHSIELRRSSGYKLLDDAAIRIVRLAAPFAPLSAQMRKDTDILHITRTWQFLSDNSFASGS